MKERNKNNIVTKKVIVTEFNIQRFKDRVKFDSLHIGDVIEIDDSFREYEDLILYRVISSQKP